MNETYCGTLVILPPALSGLLHVAYIHIIRMCIIVINAHYSHVVTMASSTKRKCVVPSIQGKIAILDYLKEGKANMKLAAEFWIGTSTS